ncbi:MAG: hypothetical protein HZB19_05140 [Chloroflexi bacterium]|nr:hypothetical protein [Chloroflexota bacterium]
MTKRITRVLAYIVLTFVIFWLISSGLVSPEPLTELIKESINPYFTAISLSSVFASLVLFLLSLGATIFIPGIGTLKKEEKDGDLKKIWEYLLLPINFIYIYFIFGLLSAFGWWFGGKSCDLPIVDVYEIVDESRQRISSLSTIEISNNEYIDLSVESGESIICRWEKTNDELIILDSSSCKTRLHTHSNSKGTLILSLSVNEPFCDVKAIIPFTISLTGDEP